MGKDIKKTLSKKRENKKAQAILDFVRAMEKEKLYYFLLATSNSCDVLVMKTPENTKKDNKIEQRFLGYEWSNRKGDEGLKYLNVKTVKKAKSDEAEEDDTISQVKGINGIVTPLFNPLNLIDDYKINTLIRKNFNNKFEDVPEELSEYVNMHSLTSLLDFKQTGFDKNININIAYKVKIQSKYELVPLSKYVIVNPSKTEIKGLNNDTEVSFIDMASVSDRGYISNKLPKTIEELRKGSYTYFAENDIIVAKITPCMENGKCAIAKDLLNGIAMGSTEFHVFRCMPQILNGYLFALLNNDYVRSIAQKNMKGSSGHKRVPETFYKDMMIPLPPLDVQEKIAKESLNIDTKQQYSEQTIQVLSEQISSIMENLGNTTSVMKLGDLCQMQAGKFVKASEIHSIEDEKYKYPCYGGNGFRGYTDTMTNEGTYTLIGRQGALCGNINVATGQFHATEHAVVVYPKEDIVDSKWLHYTLQKMNLNQYATGVAQPGLSVQRLLQLTIEVPTLIEQKQIVKEIEKLEIQINEARSFIESSSAKKQEILEKYLL